MKKEEFEERFKNERVVSPENAGLYFMRAQ